MVLSNDYKLYHSPKDSYKDRIYTTGVTGFDGVKHIAEPEVGEAKIFGNH